MSDSASKILRTFACDCADRAINRAREVGHEIDPRILEAVRVSRLYADGKATGKELEGASSTAMYSAWKQSFTSIMCVAWSASWAATTDTGEAATKAAEWASLLSPDMNERKWQVNRLIELIQEG
jgi:hypothetical protein